MRQTAHTQYEKMRGKKLLEMKDIDGWADKPSISQMARPTLLGFASSAPTWNSMRKLFRDTLLLGNDRTANRVPEAEQLQKFTDIRSSLVKWLRIVSYGDHLSNLSHIFRAAANAPANPPTHRLSKEVT
jgi:hypothetical protein